MHENKKQPNSDLEAELALYLDKLLNFFTELQNKDIDRSRLEDFDEIEISQQEKDKFLQYLVSSNDQIFISKLDGQVQRIIKQLIYLSDEVSSDFTEFLHSLNKLIVEKKRASLSQEMQDFLKRKRR